MKNNIIQKVNNLASRTGLSIKKHSPEILTGVGIVGVVASTVLACRATLKVTEVLKESKELIDTIHETVENESISDEYYSEEDAKRDLTIAYVQTSVKIAKLYAPAVGLAALSIASIIASNGVLKKRNAALASAYSALNIGFKKYRRRVADRFGEEVEQEIKNGVRKVEVEEETTDAKGKKKTVKKTVKYADPENVSPYARFFEEYTRAEDGSVVRNDYWDESNEYNLEFLLHVQASMNDLLKSRYSERKGYGIVFLNEVYKALGLPMSKAGQVVGWIYKPEDAIGDNYIDFGIHSNPQGYSDFIYGEDNGILLDFNVDGNVWDYM